MPDPRDYPQPRAPNLPVLSFGLCAGSRAGRLPSILDAGESLLLTSGRASIALCLRLIGVKHGDHVLVPAYNCRSMVHPVTWSGAIPTLYKVHPDLSVDLDDIRARLNNRTKVLMIVHYFGFPQDVKAIRSFCEEYGLQLIEDCAHAFFGKFDGLPPGSYGDYAIASIMKFYPIYDGGCVVSARHSLEEELLKSGALRFQLKALINNVERSVTYDRLRPANWLLALPLKLKDWLWGLAKSRQASIARTDHGPAAFEAGYDFDGAWIDIRMSWFSRLIFRRTSIDRIIKHRRRNYEYLLTAFADLPGCRCLMTELPDDIVPYVFPLFVESPQQVFPKLKYLGVPIFRWEDIEDHVCETSTLFSQHLLQFPCHHELRRGELKWIAEAVVKAISG